jgi:hypothetical protein
MRTRILVIAMVVATSRLALGSTLFLNHFDAPLGSGAGAADYAAGDPNQQIGSPNGPGGTIVSSPAKFGAGSLDRTTGGRIEYQTTGNYNINVGTVEMWINSTVMSTDTGFRGLWGTDTSTGNDIRMYLYNTGSGRTLGGYMLGGAPFWEIEQPVPVGLLTDNTWHHVAWSWDLAAGTTATWWDGQLLRNTPDAGTVNPRALTATLMHIGENQAGSATWPGYIDEFRISDAVMYNMNGNFTPPNAPFVVPEPASIGLLMTGMLLLARRPRRAASPALCQT